MGVDSPKSTLETENHVPKAEHIDPIKLCLIRDDLHMREHLRSKGHHLTPITLPTSWFGGGVSHQGCHLHFCKKGVKLVPDCIKRTCYKELWNLLTRPSSMVRNGSSSKMQLLPTRPRRLRCGCGGTFWPSSALRIGPWGVQTSTPWTVNCGLFWRTWLAESITTTWRAWRDPSLQQWQRFPWRQCVWRQQSGRSVSRLALKQRAAILSDIIVNENLKLLQINFLAQKVDV